MLILSSGAAAGVGMARFGFGPLLPAMRDDLGWSLSQAGFVQGANLAGYVLGSIAAPWLARRFGLTRPFLFAYLAVGGALVATGLLTGTPMQVALRAVAGMAAAVLWICGGTIAARLSSDDSSGLLIGLFFGGLGAGVVATGLLIPFALGRPEGWRVAWVLMGTGALVLLPLVGRALRAIDATISQEPPPTTIETHPNRTERLVLLEASYFLFGLGSIGFMTFIVALLREQDTAPNMVAIFWISLGVSILIAGRLWAAAISGSRSGRLLTVMYLVQAAAGLIAIASKSPFALTISAVAFGSVFVASVAATTHLIRLHLPPENWTPTLARFTVGFGLALTVGSFATGVVSDRYGITAGIAASAVTITAAALAAGMQSGPTERLA